MGRKEVMPSDTGSRAEILVIRDPSLPSSLPAGDELRSDEVKSTLR